MPATAHTFRAGRTVQAANTWRQNYDALRWLDISRAVSLIEQERRGVLSDVQWVYELVEQSDADMIALVSLRAAAIKRLKPIVLTADSSTRGFDKALADEQEAALRATYDAANTAEAVSWLAMATFRGFSILQVVPGADGLPKRTRRCRAGSSPAMATAAPGIGTPPARRSPARRSPPPTASAATSCPPKTS